MPRGFSDKMRAEVKCLLFGAVVMGVFSRSIELRVGLVCLLRCATRFSREADGDKRYMTDRTGIYLGLSRLKTARRSVRDGLGPLFFLLI